MENNNTTSTDQSINIDQDVSNKLSYNDRYGYKQTTLKLDTFNKFKKFCKEYGLAAIPTLSRYCEEGMRRDILIK